MAVEQCYAYARKMWNAAYSKNKLVVNKNIITGPQLWAAADDQGYSTSDDAVAKSIVCWDDGGYGHVAWVVKNNGNDTMKISESNWPIGVGPTTRTVNISKRGSYKLLGFVFP